MKNILLVVTTALALGLDAAAEAPELPPFAKWNIYKNAQRIGKVETVPPAPDSPQGVLRFLPAEGAPQAYSITAYCRIPTTAEDRWKLTADYRVSQDMKGKVKLQLYFQSRSRRGKWIPVSQKALPTRISPQPGSSGKLECRIDLNEIPEAAEIANIVPSVVVTGLENGSLEITRATLEPWDLGQELRQPQAAVSIGAPSKPTIGVPGFRVITDKLRNFQWPSPLAIYKFHALIERTPLGINELTLRPVNRAAGFQWPDGYTVLARYHEGKWRLEAGRLPGSLDCVGELKGETLRLGEFGTGVLAQADGKQLTVGGAESHSGVTMLLQDGAPEPNVFSKGLLAEILHWCYLEEAAGELARVKKIFTRNRAMLEKNQYFVAKRWEMRLNHVESRLRQYQQFLKADSRGYVPILAENPMARDRYNYLIALAANMFCDRDNQYVGPIFHDIWFTHMQGSAEVADALALARAADKFFARAYYDQKQAFQLGRHCGDLLSAGWCDNLTQVPRRACGPENLTAAGELALAREESEGIQLVLTAGKNAVEDCSVTLKPALPEGLQVKFHLVDYIRSLPPPVPMLPLSGQGEWIADILKTIPADHKFTVAPESNQSLWMTFSAAENAKPGTYEFTAVVTAADRISLELPLRITIEKFAIGPNRLANMAGLRSSVLRRYYCNNDASDPRFAQARRNFIAAYLDYKMNPVDLYVSSPAMDDLPFALQHGLREINVGSQFDDFADPSPSVPRFVRLYGSADGKTYRLLKASARLEKRGSGPLADTDLLVTPDASEPQFPYYKIHYAEDRDWFTTERGAIRLYPDEGNSVELTDAEGRKFAPRALQFIQPDKTPETSKGFRSDPLPKSFVFDQLQTRRKILTHGSVVVAVPDGKKPAGFRLVNRQIEKAAKTLREKFDQYRAVAGDKVTYYLYGYDETPGHVHGKVLSAARRLRQAFPQLRTVSTIARVAEPEIYENLAVHSPGNGSSLFQIDAGQRRKTGTDFWIYVGGGSYYPFASFERVDQPLIQSRGFFFPMVAFDHITGWLHWATNSWDQTRSKDQDWSRWDPSHGNNSGMKAIFYPGEDLQCYPSLRAEAMRDGIEDVNYARLAEELIRRKKFPDGEAREAAMRELAAIRNGFARSISLTCRDPEQLKSLRRQLSALLNRLWDMEN